MLWYSTDIKYTLPTALTKNTSDNKYDFIDVYDIYCSGFANALAYDEISCCDSSVPVHFST